MATRAGSPLLPTDATHWRVPIEAIAPGSVFIEQMQILYGYRLRPSLIGELSPEEALRLADALIHAARLAMELSLETIEDAKR